MDEVCIIGRGVAGLALGLRLMDAGFKVKFVGPPSTATTASYAATGMSYLKAHVQAREPLFALKQAGNRNLPLWIKRVEKDSGTLIPHSFNGVSEIFNEISDYQKVSERVFKREFRGCRPVISQYGQDIQGIVTLKYFTDGYFDHDCLMRCLVKANEKRGAFFVEDAVEKISESKIVTKNGAIAAKHIVLAAGFETEKIAVASGFNFRRQIGISGSSFLFNQGDLQPTAFTKGTYGILQWDEQCVVGASSHRYRENVSEDLVAQGREDLTKILVHFPYQKKKLEGQTYQQRWGVRSRFADRKPRMGLFHQYPTGGKLWIMCGFYKSGLQLADLFAEAQTKMISEQNMPKIFENFLI